MLRVYGGFTEYDSIRGYIAYRNLEVGNEVRETIAKIIEAGVEEVNRTSEERDGALPREISKEEWEAAAEKCDPVILKDLLRAAKNIKAYQKSLMPKGGEWDTPDGGKAGVLVRPVNRAGLYVPGGTSAYPSTVLMTAIAAVLPVWKRLLSAPRRGKC